MCFIILWIQVYAKACLAIKDGNPRRRGGRLPSERVDYRLNQGLQVLVVDWKITVMVVMSEGTDE